MTKEKQKIGNQKDCSIIDSKGSHCPGNPTHKIIHNEEEYLLCDECFISYKNGTYQK